MHISRATCVEAFLQSHDRLRHAFLAKRFEYIVDRAAFKRFDCVLIKGRDKHEMHTFAPATANEAGGVKTSRECMTPPKMYAINITTPTMNSRSQRYEKETSCRKYGLMIAVATVVSTIKSSMRFKVNWRRISRILSMSKA